MTDQPYTPMGVSPIARLCHRIVLARLADRPHLRAVYELHGGRLEDDPETGGVLLYVGGELIAQVPPSSIALGLELEDTRHGN